MKVAIFSESPADEAAIRILMEVVLGQPIEPVYPRSIRFRGWPSVLNLLPNVVNELHYNTEARGLIVVADTNGSPFYTDGPDPPAEHLNPSRLRQLRDRAEQALRLLRPRPPLPNLKVAVGVAAPAIEAWYRCGYPDASEAAWLRELRAGAHARDKIKALKREVYGTDRPSVEIATKHAKAEATRVSADLDRLERSFPIGFGALAESLRTWLTKDSTQMQ